MELIYNEKTKPVVGFYEQEGMLMRFNVISSDDVIAAIKERCGLA